VEDDDDPRSSVASPPNASSNMHNHIIRMQRHQSLILPLFAVFIVFLSSKRNKF
jgi:hypothetical protein